MRRRREWGRECGRLGNWGAINARVSGRQFFAVRALLAATVLPEARPLFPAFVYERFTF